ncbi:hypothetical protein FA13DRAFT_1714414 [Coprinellus micaceus]|uniref:RING-type domain-containing protein n=1 Tax=Coprinellus micaceus TaxID=71717 RepID=A0A4Y7SU25_COPMI|nr:hypothetical protein FA13DRAFT_1714414 [Coprinellus micaceus]
MLPYGFQDQRAMSPRPPPPLPSSKLRLYPVSFDAKGTSRARGNRPLQRTHRLPYDFPNRASEAGSHPAIGPPLYLPNAMSRRVHTQQAQPVQSPSFRLGTPSSSGGGATSAYLTPSSPAPARSSESTRSSTIVSSDSSGMKRPERVVERCDIPQIVRVTPSDAQDCRDGDNEFISKMLSAYTLHLDCGICKDMLSLPHTLPCGHTFCGPCLRKALDGELKTKLRRLGGCEALGHTPQECKLIPQTDGQRMRLKRFLRAHEQNSTEIFAYTCPLCRSKVQVAPMLNRSLSAYMVDMLDVWLSSHEAQRKRRAGVFGLSGISGWVVDDTLGEERTVLDSKGGEMYEARTLLETPESTSAPFPSGFGPPATASRASVLELDKGYVEGSSTNQTDQKDKLVYTRSTFSVLEGGGGGGVDQCSGAVTHRRRGGPREVFDAVGPSVRRQDVHLLLLTGAGLFCRDAKVDWMGGNGWYSHAIVAPSSSGDAYCVSIVSCAPGAYPLGVGSSSPAREVGGGKYGGREGMVSWGGIREEFFTLQGLRLGTLAYPLNNAPCIGQRIGQPVLIAPTSRARKRGRFEDANSDRELGDAFPGLTEEGGGYGVGGWGGGSMVLAMVLGGDTYEVEMPRYTAPEAANRNSDNGEGVGDAGFVVVVVERKVSPYLIRGVETFSWSVPTYIEGFSQSEGSPIHDRVHHATSPWAHTDPQRLDNGPKFTLKNIDAIARRDSNRGQLKSSPYSSPEQLPVWELRNGPEGLEGDGNERTMRLGLFRCATIANKGSTFLAGSHTKELCSPVINKGALDEAELRDLGMSPSMHKLCDDIVRMIFALAVESGVPSPDAAASGLSMAPLVAVQLSHVNTHWRWLAKEDPMLWAQHLRVHPRMSPLWLSKLIQRTRNVPVRIYLLGDEAGLREALRSQIVPLMARCVYFLLETSNNPKIMSDVLMLHAPALLECSFICVQPRQVFCLWRVLFGGHAPKLRCLRVLRKSTGQGLACDGIMLSHLSIPGLLSLSKMSQLLSLELSFPTTQGHLANLHTPFGALSAPATLSNIRDLKLTGDPFSVSHFLDATRLPNVQTMAIIYTFTIDTPSMAAEALWTSLLGAFPSNNFPVFGVCCDAARFECRLQHVEGPVVHLQFDARALGVGHMLSTTSIPLLVLPASETNNRDQVLHSILWTPLALNEEFTTSVKTVVITSPDPQSTFPYHLHLLLCYLADVRVLQFCDRAAARDPSWFRFLSTSIIFDNMMPLPCLEQSSLKRWQRALVVWRRFAIATSARPGRSVAESIVDEPLREDLETRPRERFARQLGKVEAPLQRLSRRRDAFCSPILQKHAVPRSMRLRLGAHWLRDGASGGLQRAYNVN